MGEGVKSSVEGVRAKTGGWEIETEDNKRGLESEGRQNVALGYNRPPQKSTKTGGGDDGGGSTLGAVTSDHPKGLFAVRRREGGSLILLAGKRKSQGADALRLSRKGLMSAFLREQAFHVQMARCFCQRSRRARTYSCLAH